MVLSVYGRIVRDMQLIDSKVISKTFESNTYRPLPRHLTIKDRVLMIWGFLPVGMSPPVSMLERLTLKLMRFKIG